MRPVVDWERLAEARALRRRHRARRRRSPGPPRVPLGPRASTPTRWAAADARGRLTFVASNLVDPDPGAPTLTVEQVAGRIGIPPRAGGRGSGAAAHFEAPASGHPRVLRRRRQRRGAGRTTRPRWACSARSRRCRSPRVRHRARRPPLADTVFRATLANVDRAPVTRPAGGEPGGGGALVDPDLHDGRRLRGRARRALPPAHRRGGERIRHVADKAAPRSRWSRSASSTSSARPVSCSTSRRPTSRRR